MDDGSQALEAYANILDQISEDPYNASLHAQHIRLAQSLQGMDAEAQTALEMMSEFLAAGDDVWLPLIQAKESAVNLQSPDGVDELLTLYDRAEADYLSIPILQKHLQFLVDNHARYLGEELKPADLEDVFSTQWTRGAIAGVVSKGINHLTQSHLLWDIQRDWEMQVLEGASGSEKATFVEHVKQLHLDRLHQPHSNSDETFQSYSSFTTNYQTPQDYEQLMVAASKIRTQVVKAYNRRERLESALAQSNYSLESYANYIRYERQAKHPDLSVTQATYERAVAEAAKRRFNGIEGSEEFLRAFWIGYCDALRILGAEKNVRLSTFRRAIRGVPESGEVWARYIRLLEHLSYSDAQHEGLDTVSDIYTKALSTNLLQTDAEQIIPVILARAGFEKRRWETGGGDEDSLVTVIGVLESGVEMVHKASKTGDVKLRLEKFLASVYGAAGLIDNELSLWQRASKQCKSSYLVWTQLTDTLIKSERYEEARKVFDDIHTKQLDWPEAIWEAWVSFEHAHGSVKYVESAMDKIEKAQYQTNSRRAKEAERAAYQAMQTVAEAQSNVPVPTVPGPEATQDDVAMNVDVEAPERGKKRAAEEEPLSEGHKKARFEQKNPPLKRDRENSSVFVAELPTGVTNDELKDLFKDCGSVREIKITQLPGELVATVEFLQRDSIPAALTKDKKRLRDQEVAVHLAWKSTLYVTNFPESADDPYMRNLFGKYGVIFDVRWPSKKFKTTRRFCYIQYTAPNSAERALELHGRELEPNLPINVYISNPERKKERTDQDANEREVYVAGFSKYTTKADLEKLFSTYGKLKEVRIATEPDGLVKGYAFIEYEEAKDAQTALAANNYELKKRRIAVTLSDSRVRARHRQVPPNPKYQFQKIRSRSVRIRNLPPATQEGLLQQVLEKIAPVKRVEVFVDKQEAVVELENPAEAGKLLLRTEAVVFNGHTLELMEEGRDGSSTRASAPPPKAGGLFVPRRAAVSRPRAGLGHARAAVASKSTTQDRGAASQASSSKASSGKGQDDFRKMLG
ncbi:hypothetical protein K443DRAFT_1909 [Laccaria amethystina LaAM-08-1]|uniref:U4/U6 snRNA-associated-splicing factor PRP24 n=1 Tax=Laccaria amethystina LaAM-08-1 TaxID=1095629 RepID=A0A0C9YIZ2_9AGAR|nr:hypothetical protein K443DRAFT_1909 [Laccaria amethystina LaAM-08-1]